MLRIKLLETNILITKLPLLMAVSERHHLPALPPHLVPLTYLAAPTGRLAAVMVVLIHHRLQVLRKVVIFSNWFKIYQKKFRRLKTF